MEVLILLVPLSLVLVGIAVWLFLRMSDSGQFDDLEGPAHSILMDDDRPRAPGDRRENETANRSDQRL